ncbi:MAG: Rieske 2Fe-2S domain-containing protein [candidate division Zixibacteria bacterium]|nr:Rieske 2Fe-2S domain-containing protein [candidate division Zixibacteria bacterium]
MTAFRKVATVSEVPEGTLKSCEIANQKFLVAHTSDGFYAVVDECSHDMAPISTGQITGNEIICPRHQARFDLKTGAVKAPPAIVSIDTLELKIDGDNILVFVEE